MDFVFIAAYWLEFLLISILLTRRRFPFAKGLGVFAGLCATLAALLDVRENLAILRVLTASPTPDNDPLVQAVLHAAVLKWTLLFIAMIILSFVILGRRDRNTKSGFVFLLPGLFLLTGTIGLIGIGQDAMLEWIEMPMSFGLVSLILAFLWAPSRLLQGL
jgi:hypothetical protein